ncbi:Spore coat protein A [Rubripirellula lacrimiformis]|uniref:Spore coat protein A n=1 Tax=Rubripirellula lacrimiformis TaxID=1930273 RepID=A0A517N5H7_9BACT|nr:multicopper oxidase domain-containing protein [Rubripirellula lacrimiformis]QDT02396.1 Spore coat protein A [Rubripirellula lacrimiformis]
MSNGRMSNGRREFLKQGVTAGLCGTTALVQGEDLHQEVRDEMAGRLNFLSAPQGSPPSILVSPSPKVRPFTTPFFTPCVPEPLFAFVPEEYPLRFEISQHNANTNARILLTKADIDRVTLRLSRQQLESTSELNLAWLAGFWKRFTETATSLANIDIDLGDLPDPFAHQRFFDFKTQYFYAMWEVEFAWRFDECYGKDSYNWGFASFCKAADHPKDNGNYASYQDCQFEPLRKNQQWKRDASVGLPAMKVRLQASSPGPTFQARYGQPVMVRRVNSLPEILNDAASYKNRRRIKFALPSTTTHLHNAHTASESDGNPNDWINTGEYWDHHYGNFPSGYDPNEKLSTLWYHDHRMDFTAANVYAGLDGFYTLFDETTDDAGADLDESIKQDVGVEGEGWGLPAGDYDVPMILHDLLFAHPDGEKEETPPYDPSPQLVFDGFNTDGIIGDRLTVNRIIQPVMKVEPRKYRFRILNGGPSRFYELTIHTESVPAKVSDGKPDRDANGDLIGEIPFIVIAGDGNFQPNALLARSLYLGVAQRCDVVIDFSEFAGQNLYMVNVLDQINGRGPSGREYHRDTFVSTDISCQPADGVEPFFQEQGMVKFEVGKTLPAPDKSTLPLAFRSFPPVDLTEVRRERLWEFDFDGGLWTVNGLTYDPNRIDAGIEQDTAEIWTMRNNGNSWSHPIHSHFTEFIVLEINGVPQYQYTVQESEVQNSIPFLKKPRSFIQLDGQFRDQIRDSLEAIKKSSESENKMQNLYEQAPAAREFLKRKTRAASDQPQTLEQLLQRLITNAEQWKGNLYQQETQAVVEIQRIETVLLRSYSPEDIAKTMQQVRVVIAAIMLSKFGTDHLRGQVKHFVDEENEFGIEQIRFQSAKEFRLMVVLLRILGIAELDLRNNGDSIKGEGRFMGGPRRDVAILLPDWEVTMFMRWKDFLGKHVMHCHNVVHEDHAMMIRWDIVPPGHGFDTPKRADRFYSVELPHEVPHVQPMPEHASSHENDSDQALDR